VIADRLFCRSWLLLRQLAIGDLDITIVGQTATTNLSLGMSSNRVL
jgi:hypothetical protein